MTFSRASALACATLLLLTLCIAPAFAKARLVIVFPLRSTPALAVQAKIASNSIVTKLSAIEGYDAQLLAEPKTGTLGAAAAAAGAEIYVVGQLVESEAGYKIIAGSFSAATEQPVGNYTAQLASADALPAQPDIKSLLAATPSAPPVPAPAQAKLLLVPYDLPGSSDPYALGISQNLISGLAGIGTPVARIAPIDGLDATANAAKICADNGGSGIIIPDGRYQATIKPGFMSLTVTSHVDFRLDEISCDGVVRWSTAAVGDDTVSGLRPDFTGSMNAAYNAAVQHVTAARSTASVPQSSPRPKPAVAPVAPSAVSTYVLVPFDVLGMADQRKPDITSALLAKLQARHLDVKVASPMDRITVVGRAAQLCSENSAQAIVVPGVRMEQTAGTGLNAVPHAVLRLSLLNCDGALVAGATSKGNFKPTVLFFRDPDQAVIDAANDAEDAAIAQVFSR